MKQIFHTIDFHQANDGVAAAYIGRIHRFARDNLFVYAIRPEMKAGKHYLHLALDHPLHLEKLMLHLEGDRQSAQQNVYVVNFAQHSSEAWGRAAKSFLAPIEGDYEVRQSPQVHIAFNWLSDLVAFKQAAGHNFIAASLDAPSSVPGALWQAAAAPSDAAAASAPEAVKPSILFNLPLPQGADKNVRDVYMRKISKVAKRHGFECPAEITDANNQVSAACQVNDPIHALKMQLHFEGDRLSMSSHRYLVPSHNQTDHWLERAQKYLRDRPEIGAYLPSGAPAFVFNWRSDYLAFLEAERRGFKPAHAITPDQDFVNMACGYTSPAADIYTAPVRRGRTALNIHVAVALLTSLPTNGYKN